MTRGMRYGILTIAAALALLLVVADFVLVEFNRSAQIEVNARQQFINQSIELGQVNQALVRAIAVAAIKNNDKRLGQILTDQGITVAQAPSAAGATSAAVPGIAGAASQKDKP